MDYAQQQRDPVRHAIGIGFVVLVHALVIWALMSGLGKTMIEVIKKPLNATIIEEVKLPPPPPPPPKKIIEPPKAQPLVQPYVPPPDIPVTAPTTAPVISSVTATPPPEPVQIAAPVAVAPAPKPAVRRGISPIEREEITYPRSAIKAGVDKGQVIARVHIDERGNVYEVTIVSPPNRHFDPVVIEALKKWKFKPDGEKYVGEIEINFTLKDS